MRCGAASNIEFIRRINGLDFGGGTRKFDRLRCQLSAWLGFGRDWVYPGVPVATLLDPRHRESCATTKYNPARTWTAENSVGIGGAYLCVYGMEGPGGYQFVGRTVQMWNTWRTTKEFAAGTPWLLRFFDHLVLPRRSQRNCSSMQRRFAAREVSSAHHGESESVCANITPFWMASAPKRRSRKRGSRPHSKPSASAGRRPASIARSKFRRKKPRPLSAPCPKVAGPSTRPRTAASYAGSHACWAIASHRASAS